MSSEDVLVVEAKKGWSIFALFCLWAVFAVCIATMFFAESILASGGSSLPRYRWISEGPPWGLRLLAGLAVLGFVRPLYRFTGFTLGSAPALRIRSDGVDLRDAAETKSLRWDQVARFVIEKAGRGRFRLRIGPKSERGGRAARDFVFAESLLDTDFQVILDHVRELGTGVAIYGGELPSDAAQQVRDRQA